MDKNLAKLFADNIKVYTTVNTEEESNNLQIDNRCSNEVVRELKKNKSKHLHIGQETGAKYTMTEPNKERDLGIIIAKKLDFLEHIIPKLERQIKNKVR